MKFNQAKQIIIETVKKNQPINISKLAKKIGLSKGSSIYRYLRELENENIIIMKKEIGKRKRGNPTFIYIKNDIQKKNKT